MKKMISRLPEAKTKIPMPINPRGNNHIMKYEDLRPCSYDVFENESTPKNHSPYKKFVETVKGRCFKIMNEFDEDGSSCLYAIVELENGTLESTGLHNSIYHSQRNFRFTDHNTEEEDNDKTT